MLFPLILIRLQANADAISALVTGVEDGQARWKPEPSQWSILEVVNHLADKEVEDFRRRLDCTLNRPYEPWPPIDPKGWPEERSYNSRSLDKSLDRFLTRRHESLAFLQELEAPDWNLAYEHLGLGVITAGDLLKSWVEHDHRHVRQLNRLHQDFLVKEISAHSIRYAADE